MGKKDRKSKQLAAERRARLTAARPPGDAGSASADSSGGSWSPGSSPVSGRDTVAGGSAGAGETAGPIEGKLRSAWLREQGFWTAGGLCRLAVWAVGLFLANLAIDWSLDVPGGGRLLMLAADIAVLAVVAFRDWFAKLSPFDPLLTALKVERLFPDLRTLLVSYVQFEDKPDPAGASPTLVAALRRRAADATAALDFSGVVDFSKLKPVGTLAGVVLLLFAASNSFAGEFYAVLVARMLDPQSTLEYPTRTQIVRFTEDVAVRAGDPLTLTAEAAGEIPGQGVLQIRHGDGPWERLDMPRVEGAGGVFERRFPEVERSFEYRVRLGDAVSKVKTVKAVPAPRIVSARIRVVYPAYTGLPPRDVDGLNAEVPEGSRLDWRITLDQELRAAEAIVYGPAIPATAPATSATAPATSATAPATSATAPGTAPAAPAVTTEAMTVDPKEPQVVRWSVVARQGFAYQLKWTNAPYGFGYQDSLRNQIRVSPDAPPTAEILPPVPDERATVNKTLTLRFRARDDFGLKEAWIVYSVNEGPEMRRAAGLLNGTADAREVQWKPRDSIKDLKEGDLLTFAVEVVDNRVHADGPNRSRTRPLRMQFLSAADYLRYVQETRAELFNRLTGVHQEELESSDTVKTLKREATP